MATGITLEKLKILADSAKYDVSCSTSGVERSNSGKMGNAVAAGICHTWSADGRCVSLLKVLLSNRCAYDCAYCVNRRTAEAPRASFEPEELASLTMEFYRRNYIEGLFVSSAVEVSPDHTAERILKTLILLREQHRFAGYIHAKIIPGVSQELVQMIGLYADRLSVNIELPTRESLGLLAPQKKAEGIFKPMGQIKNTLLERKALKGPGSKYSTLTKGAESSMYIGETPSQYLTQRQEQAAKGLPVAGVYHKEIFAPAGQTTQMIIGATPDSDRQIIKLSESLYRTFQLKRVYFSAYIPVVESPSLPSLHSAPPLAREHRLYQADWLLRFYGFEADELLDEKNPFLDPQLDPKITWALRHPEMFPIEVNKASMEELLRIPGIGMVSAKRIVRQRRFSAVRFEDLKKMGVTVKRAKYFVTCGGRYRGGIDLDPGRIRSCLLPDHGEEQLSMFGGNDIGLLV